MLVTVAEKGRTAKHAKAAGLSRGEFLRRTAESFRPADDDQSPDKMLYQMIKSTAETSDAIDEALAFVDASNKRIRTLEMCAKGKGASWTLRTRSGTVIKMNDKVDRMASTMKIQQERLANLAERVIRLQTALEIALANSGVRRSTSRRLERKD